MNPFLRALEEEHGAAGDLPPEASPMIGRLLVGKWRVGSLLGRGGMSSVYAAVHRNGKQVAIKVLHPVLASNARARARFLREGYIANKIAHQGIAPVLDDGVTDDGLVFLVMELLSGATLDQHCRARGGRLTESEALVIADSVLEVLAAAHGKGVVHRDIKPSNIFLTADGALKLLDFGAARLRETSGSRADTRSGALLGTPGFMAPEQARGRWDEVDARTDLWAVGATMFRLLTGRFVHEADTPNEAIIAAAVSRAPSLASVDSSLGTSADIVDRALKLDPRDRWASATEMQAAVRRGRACVPSCDLPRPAAASEATATVDESSLSRLAADRMVPPPPAAPPRSLFTRNRRALIVGAMAALALALGSWLSMAVERRSLQSHANGQDQAPSTSPKPIVPPIQAAPAGPAASLSPANTAGSPAPAHSPSATARKRSRPRPTAAERTPAVPDSDRTDDDPSASSLAPASVPAAAPGPARLEDVLDERR